MALNSQFQTPASTTWWKQPLAIGLLVCAPLIVGGVRNVVSPTAKAVCEGSLEDLSESEPTLLVAAFATNDAVLLAQAGDQKETSKEADKKETNEKDAVKKADEKKDSNDDKDKKDKAEETEKSKTATKDQDSEKEPSEKDQSAASDGEDPDDEDPDDDDPECCNANSEFSEWSTTLDDDIREAVIAAITKKLTTATENLDKQQERLERLQVETELYKLQIQHLRNRLKEWDTD